MLEFLRAHQLNIMVGLSSICVINAFFVYVTRTISKQRKIALILVELSAALLLTADRLAYLYRGDVSVLGYWMVRISNFLVYSMSLETIVAFNLYITDLYMTQGQLPKRLLRMKVTNILAAVGGVLLIISQFSGLYYTFDAENHYIRGKGFLLSYVIPLLLLLIQLSIILQYYRRLNSRMSLSLLLFTLLPLVAAVMQIFAYGLSLTNMTTVGMAVVVYVFALIDMNEMVEKVREREITYLKEGQMRMKRLFDQTATSFVDALDARDTYTQGHSIRVAWYARRIAEISGKDEDACDEVYYAALMHDIERNGIAESALTRIEEFPFLSVGAHSYRERYDGNGYPEQLKGEEIPEIARITAVADAYDNMTSRTEEREALPEQVVREEFIKESGGKFDPKYAAIMVQMIQADDSSFMRGNEEKYDSVGENAFVCEEYRSTISFGMAIPEKGVRLCFHAAPIAHSEEAFSAPAIILFDSLDARVHETPRGIQDTRYVEFGELWFDGHSVSTAARNMKVTRKDKPMEMAPEEYTVEALRRGDHLKVVLKSAECEVEAIVALLDSSRNAFLCLTGENCAIEQLRREHFGGWESLEIPRIAEEITYTNRLESDLPNIQIDGPRQASTRGILLRDGMRIAFHTLTLPTASLVWNCPAFVLFSSQNGEITGDDYREYGWVRFDGEKNEDGEWASNQLTMEKTREFAGWPAWKEANKEGMECELLVKRKKKQITIRTKNAGISIENVTTILDGKTDIYLALTGDKCALTDIRIY